MARIVSPNLMRHPPAIPAGYGSLLYPQAPWFDSRCDAEPRLRALAMREKGTEAVALYDLKADNYKAIRAKYQNRASHRPYCHICSEIHLTRERDRSRYVKYHNHYSTKKIRMEATLDHYGQYVCTECDSSVHHFVTGVRYPVLASSSILNGWTGRRSPLILEQYRGLPFHIEMVTIPGARISDLKQAVWAEYSNVTKPLDILLCAGLNDLLRNYTAQDIMADLRDFKADVMAWDSRNTFAVCTLPLPPKMSHLRADPRYHRQYVGDQDCFTELNDLIPQIINLNAEGPKAVLTSRAPRFHTWGIRTETLPFNKDSTRAIGNLGQHRSGQWRESDTWDQLHLNDQARLRMGKATVGYFTKIYDIDQPPKIVPKHPPPMVQPAAPEPKQNEDVVVQGEKEEDLVQEVVVEEDTDEGILVIDYDDDKLLDISSSEEEEKGQNKAK